VSAVVKKFRSDVSEFLRLSFQQVQQFSRQQQVPGPQRVASTRARWPFT
jgi:hypothetical protein